MRIIQQLTSWLFTGAWNGAQWSYSTSCIIILLENLSLTTAFRNRKVCKDFSLENPNRELSPLKQTWWISEKEATAMEESCIISVPHTKLDTINMLQPYLQRKKNSLVAHTELWYQPTLITLLLYQQHKFVSLKCSVFLKKLSQFLPPVVDLQAKFQLCITSGSDITSA